MAFCIRYVHLHTLLSSVPTLFFSSLVGSVFGLSVLSFGSLVGRIRLVSILVSFALPLFCIFLHVRLLLVILCSFPCLSFCYFQLLCQFYGCILNLDTSKSMRQYS